MYQAMAVRVLTAPTRGVHPLPREQDAVRGCSQQWLKHVSKDTMSPFCFTCLGDTARPQPVPFQCKFSMLQLVLGLGHDSAPTGLQPTLSSVCKMWLLRQQPQKQRGDLRGCQQMLVFFKLLQKKNIKFLI